MKRMMKYVLMAAALMVSVHLVHAQKFAYVNSQDLLQDLPEVKAADAEIKTLQQQLQKKGQEMFESYQAKAMELQQRRDAGELSPRQLEQEAEKLGEDEEKIRSFENEMQANIYKKQQELLAPIQDKVNRIIDEIAKSEGYTMVFDSSSGVLLYSEESNDITQKVREKLTAEN